MTHVNSYQMTGNQQTEGLLEEALDTISVADAGRSVLNDDVYYSDDEDSENSAAIMNDKQSLQLKNSPGIDGTISTQCTDYPPVNLSMEQQHIINQMIMQMVMVNPSLASCSPLLLRELALRYLISANRSTPAAAALEADQQVQHSLLQMQFLAATNAASKQENFELSEAVSVQMSENSGTLNNSAGAKSKSFGQDAMQERMLFVEMQDKHGRRFGCDSFERCYDDRENIPCPSVGSSTDDLSEYESSILENKTQGRGRSLISSNQSVDTRLEVKPRGRGRGKRPGVQDVAEGLRCFRLSAEARPGNVNFQPMKTATPLHPPAAAMNKPTVMVNGQTSLAGASSCEKTRTVINCSEDWDEDQDRYAPRVFTVDSSFYKTSKNS